VLKLVSPLQPEASLSQNENDAVGGAAAGVPPSAEVIAIWQPENPIAAKNTKAADNIVFPKRLLFTRIKEGVLAVPPKM
jgi:hypothetical protein